MLGPPSPSVSNHGTNLATFLFFNITPSSLHRGLFVFLLRTKITYSHGGFMDSSEHSRSAPKSLIPSEGPTQPPTEPRLPAENEWSENTKKFLSEAPPPPPDARPEFIPQPSLNEDFRHSGWAPARRRVIAAMEELPEVSERRLGALKFCGWDAFVQVHRHPLTNAVTEARVRSTKCHDRFCVPCSQERSSCIRSVLLTHMMQKQNLKLITLTLKASSDPLTKILDRIGKAFRILRNKPLWKKCLKGGCSIVETKIGKNSGEWHCHLHVIAEGKFIDQSLLADLWLDVTGDSRIVDVRPVGAKTGAVSYITKYVTKAADHSIVMSPRHLAEAIVAFTGRRLVSTFGTWRGLKLMERPEDEKCEEPEGYWHDAGPLDAYIRAAGTGHEEAGLVLRLIRRGKQPHAPPV